MRASLVTVSLVFVAACRNEPTQAPEHIAAPRSEPSAVIEPVQEPPSTAEPAVDAACSAEVVPLERDDRDDRDLARRIVSTQIVTVATVSIDKADCTSIGHHHLVVEGAGTVAYRKSDLPVTPYLPHGKPYYLVGATSIADHEVDLGPVCVPYKGRVNARLDWVIALADEAEAEAWRTRLDHGACGRPPTGCSAKCTRGCGDGEGTCCEEYTDACPGPAGQVSTCIGFLPCEERCCAPR